MASQESDSSAAPRFNADRTPSLTHLLVRVRDAHEAAQAAAADIDAVELCVDDASDAGFEVARAVRAGFPGRVRLRFDKTNVTPDLVRSAAMIQADEIAFDFTDAPADGLQSNLRSVAVLAASTDSVTAMQAVRDRVDAVMLEAGPNARLIDKAGVAALDAFASACRASNLAFGLAGGLEPPDVARLLLLDPDVLGFDVALRQGHHADGQLETEAMRAIRALVPRDQRKITANVAKVIDRIFVSDLEVSLSIGAYQAEHSMRQRVRFSVVADVAREPVTPRDMSDVFSYDVIIETIRVLAERAHVTFVETLAEEVAASLLSHPEVTAVRVKVEKLDVIPGAVGIEIIRRHATP